MLRSTLALVLALGKRGSSKHPNQQPAPVGLAQTPRRMELSQPREIDEAKQDVVTDTHWSLESKLARC